MADANDPPAVRPLVPVVVGLVTLLLATWLIAGEVRSGNRLERWLVAAAGAEEDRGWSYLDPEGRERGYGDKREAYIQDARAADWSAFEWTEPRELWAEDGFAHLQAGLLSPPSSVPGYLFERRLIHGVCVDGLPVAIGVYDDRRWFQAGGLGGGGLTGSGAACNRLFTDAPR